MATPYDFKENAKALLKRIGHNPAPGVNPALALVAVETALREAFSRGQEQAKGSSGTSLKGPGKVSGKSPASQRVPASQAYLQEYADECQHEWQETFLDGRSVGSRCVRCDMLESDVRKQCDHYFVKTDAGEICVACRTPRNPRR
jgi:hypothetical protein